MGEGAIGIGRPWPICIGLQTHDYLAIIAIIDVTMHVASATEDSCWSLEEKEAFLHLRNYCCNNKKSSHLAEMEKTIQLDKAIGLLWTVHDNYFR